jgi:membrane protein DedA with SNARE-associated domain
MPELISLDGLADLSEVAYLVIFLLAAFDVVFPILPSETAVVLGGVLAWQGRLNPAAVLAVAALGAISGDHLSYGLGRWTQRAWKTRRADGKVARLQAWAAHQLEERGAAVLIVARFIPGGRTASTFVSGRLNYCLPRFSSVTVVAGVLWAAFGTSLGYLGGRTFHENTLLGTALGVAIGTTIGLVVERTMDWRHRRSARLAEAAEAPDSDEDLAA